MNNFKDRVIELTSERIMLDDKCKYIESLLDGMNYSHRTRTRFENRLTRQREALEHCINNLEVNMALSELNE